MFGLFPISVDVPMSRWPISNFILIGVIALAFLWQLATPEELTVNHPLVLHEWALTGLFAHMFLHVDLVHLVGNLLFLWVFGNAICAKVGNLAYIPLFILFGLLAGMAQLVFDPGSAAIGASGAINGVVGAFFVMYPRNDINCVYIFLVKVGHFAVSSIWIIALWFTFDIWGAVTGGGAVAYMAHLGGFAAGVVLMVSLLTSQRIKPSRSEQTLLEWIREDQETR
ncbi:MAG: rhomboid family intramembrane serine protease [Planctomycetota bacterium]